MKILLVGYGKMGKAIESIAIHRGHTIAGRVDLDLPDKITPGADVAVEFTQPESAVANIKLCLSAGIPVVCGTTGWWNQLKEVEKFCHEKKGGFFHSSNFSLGVNIFFKLNTFLAKMMNAYSNYDPKIDETHHTQKKDSPSGTAITLAEGVIHNLDRKKEWVNHETQDPGVLVINSFRADPAPGTHVVKYRSTVDDIEISHTAHSREGFALGAVMAAEWLKGKQGMFTMDDLLKF